MESLQVGFRIVHYPESAQEFSLANIEPRRLARAYRYRDAAVRADTQQISDLRESEFAPHMQNYYFSLIIRKFRPAHVSDSALRHSPGPED
jgi:hypothetical protein